LVGPGVPPKTCFGLARGGGGAGGAGGE